MRLQKQQISPELIQLRAIEVQSKALDIQSKAIDKWNGNLPQVTSGIPFIGVGGLDSMFTTFEETQ